MKRWLLIMMTVLVVACGGDDTGTAGPPLAPLAVVTEQQKQAVFQAIEDFFASLPHDSRQAETDALAGFLQSQPNVTNVRQGSL
ncbi:MAG: hypothetical protein AB1758_20515, partial [Candidatus Eremiobacterota bacterium]